MRSLEKYDNNHEALLAADIFKQMAKIATTVPEGFQAALKREVVESVGLLHWQRIGDVIGLKLTQKTAGNRQNFEIDGQLKANKDGSFMPSKAGDSIFKISRPDQNFRYLVFDITSENGSFVVQGERGVYLTEAELQDCRDFICNMADSLPSRLAAT